MFRRLRGKLSGENSGEKVAYAYKGLRARRRDDRQRPGMDHRLQRALREQNEGNDDGYSQALSEQSGDHWTADGRLLRLGVVDRETGEIVDPFLPKAEDGDPDVKPPSAPPPPPPTSVA